MTDIFYPIQLLSERIVFHSGIEGSAAGAVEFFIYDSIKIIMLLFVMIFAVGILRTHLSQKRIKAWLSGQKTGYGNFLASILGAITPFCSCSSIPIFISFLRTGVPLGVTFSFLITSPIINQYLVFIMLPTFGLKITGLYILSGLLIGTLTGMALGKMKLEKYLEKDIAHARNNGVKEHKYKSHSERLKFALSEAVDITKKTWIWILLGVGIGALIHGYVPEDLVHNVMTKGGIFTVPLATIIGVPIYGNCAAIVPVAVVLFEKGVPLGTALAFMMSTAALSLPEVIILRRAMKLRLIGIFFGIVALAIIINGYIFNIF